MFLATETLERINLYLGTCARCNHEVKEHDLDGNGECTAPCEARVKQGRICRCPTPAERLRPRLREV